MERKDAKKVVGQRCASPPYKQKEGGFPNPPVKERLTAKARRKLPLLLRALRGEPYPPDASSVCSSFPLWGSSSGVTRTPLVNFSGYTQPLSKVISTK